MNESPGGRWHPTAHRQMKMTDVLKALTADLKASDERFNQDIAKLQRDIEDHLTGLDQLVEDLRD